MQAGPEGYAGCAEGLKNAARRLRAYGLRRGGGGVGDTMMGQWRDNNGTLGGGAGAASWTSVAVPAGRGYSMSD